MTTRTLDRVVALRASLCCQVVCAVIAGVALGHYYPAWGAEMKPLGDGFIKLIKMIITPIIFCTVVIGIAGMDDIKKVGRTGGLALLCFEIITTFALVVGLVLVNVLRLGDGMNINAASLDTNAIAAFTDPAKDRSLTDFLLSIIPASIADAFARGDILQILVIATMFGFSLNRFRNHGEATVVFIENVSRLLFPIVEFIMKLAPIGAFGATAFTIGAYGVSTLASQGKLLATYCLSYFVFTVVVLGLIARLHGFSLWKFIKYIREVLLIVLGTASSLSVFPRMMEKMERLGAERVTVGLVIPAGYSFNLVGTCLYLTMAAGFIAQATNTALTLAQQLTLLGVLLLTSKAATGIAGSGFIVLAATLSVVDTVPVAGVALILGIEPFMSAVRAITNVIGNGVATLVVAKWTGKLDILRLETVLNSASWEPAERAKKVETA